MGQPLTHILTHNRLSASGQNSTANHFLYLKTEKPHFAKLFSEHTNLTHKKQGTGRIISSSPMPFLVMFILLVTTWRQQLMPLGENI